MGIHSICFRVEININSFPLVGTHSGCLISGVLLTPYVNSDNSDKLPI